MEVEFLSIDDQIKKLKEDGLVVNEENDKETLRRINYFTLVNRYKFFFTEGGTKRERFNTGTRFDEIVSAYEMDAELKILIFEYILKLEKMFSTAIAYYFCEAHPKDVFAYLKKENYEYSKGTIIVKEKTKGKSKDKEKEWNFEIDALIYGLSSKIVESSDGSIEYFRKEKAGQVPLWVLINTLSFGELSDMFMSMKIDQKNKIVEYMNKHYVKQYPNYPIDKEAKIADSDIAKFLKLLKIYRNICAHNEGLIVCSLDTNKKNIDLLSLLKEMKKYLSKEEHEKLTKKTESIFEDYRAKINKNSFSEILKATGYNK